MPSSTSLYETFGNEVKYKVAYDALVAYMENATINFPLPEASVDILQDLTDASVVNPQELEIVTRKLESIGFKPSKANVMATILLQVAKEHGVDPMDYFVAGEAALKLTTDTYQVINTLRPRGNQIGLAKSPVNSKSKFKDFIKK